MRKVVLLVALYCTHYTASFVVIFTERFNN